MKLLSSSKTIANCVSGITVRVQYATFCYNNKIHDFKRSSQKQESRNFYNQTRNVNFNVRIIISDSPIEL